MKPYSGSQKKMKRKARNHVLSDSLFNIYIYIYIYIDFQAKSFLVTALSGEACKVAVTLAPELTEKDISRYDIFGCGSRLNAGTGAARAQRFLRFAPIQVAHIYFTTERRDFFIFARWR